MKALRRRRKKPMSQLELWFLFFASFLLLWATSFASMSTGLPPIKNYLQRYGKNK